MGGREGGREGERERDTMCGMLVYVGSREGGRGGGQEGERGGGGERDRTCEGCLCLWLLATFPQKTTGAGL